MKDSSQRLFVSSTVNTEHPWIVKQWPSEHKHIKHPLIPVSKVKEEEYFRAARQDKQKHIAIEGDSSREHPALALRQGWDWLQQQHPVTPWKGISGYGQWHDMTWHDTSLLQETTARIPIWNRSPDLKRYYHPSQMNRNWKCLFL